MEKKKDLFTLNYIYFTLLFLALAALQVYHVLLIGNNTPQNVGMYVSVAILESFIEVAVLSWISMFLLKRGYRFFHIGFVCFISLLFFLRLADFAVVRLMDVSAWRWIDLVFKESFENFIEMLYSSNVKLSVWMKMGAFVFLAMALNCVFFALTYVLCKKNPWAFSSKKALSFCVLGLLASGVTEMGLYVSQAPYVSYEYVKALPWKRTLLDTKAEMIEVKGCLKDPCAALTLSELDSSAFSLQRKPDIFLFITESLRDDFMTQQVSPALTRFRLENTHFSKALSASNGTHKTWFSLFYSLYPFYWKKYQPGHWKEGALPLALLKKMGYETHVYASSRLSYYAMDESLFGANRKLIDHIHEFRDSEDLSPSETDSMAINQLCEDLESSTQKGGRVFITFLDATHFGYSWPENKAPKFLPIDKSINYLEMICGRKQLDPVKNRYRNAIRFVDELFAQFEQTAKQKDLWNEAIVVFTADHGEEFDEEGCIFHASGLSLPQLQIPLYVKMGKEPMAESLDVNRRASQIDVFPTVLHYITGDTSLGSLFQGQSLFGSQDKGFTLGARYNASELPFEFYVQKGRYRMVLEFGNTKDIFHSRLLKVKALFNEKEERVPFSISFLENYFEEALDQLFSLP